MLDDALSENTVSAAFDDIVSQRPAREGTRWSPARKHPLSGVLDAILMVTSRDSAMARVVRSCPRQYLTTARRRAHPGMRLGDYRQRSVAAAGA